MITLSDQQNVLRRGVNSLKIKNNLKIRFKNQAWTTIKMTIVTVIM